MSPVGSIAHMRSVFLFSLVWGVAGCSAVVSDSDDFAPPSEGVGEGEGEGEGEGGEGEGEGGEGEGEGGEGEGGVGEGEGEGGARIPDPVQAVFGRRCVACHFEGNVPPDLSDPRRSYLNLVGVPSELSCVGDLLVKPGDAAASCLVKTLEGVAATRMPPAGPLLDADDQRALRNWIAGVAADVTVCGPDDTKACPCPDGQGGAQACAEGGASWVACGCGGQGGGARCDAQADLVGVSCFDPDVSPCPQHLVCDEGGWLACQPEYVRQDAESEACNGVDDDCDGETDDNFDLRTDASNCGSCGTVCAFPNASEVGCERGECVLIRCEDEFADVNGDVEDGCEFEGVKNLFVSSLGDDHPDHDDWPSFTTVAAAHEAILENEVAIIHLDAVPVVENVEILKPDVTLRGMDPVLSVINATAQPHSTLLIDADNVTIENLRVSGGHKGIHVMARRGVVIRDVEVGGVTGAGSIERIWAVGIHMAGTVDGLVERVGIRGVSGGPANVPVVHANGGAAAGLWFDGVVRGTARAVSIETITAQGRSDRGYSAPAQGLRATDSISVALDGIRVRGITSPSNHYTCDEGVCNAGVFVRDTTALRIHRLLVHDIVQPVVDQLACGVYLRGPSTVGATLDRMTLADITGASSDGGLCLFESAQAIVTDSIFSGTARWAARDLSANPGGSVVRNSIVWLPDHRDQEFHEVAADRDTVVRVDPGFDPITGGFRLAPDSPAVDAGRLDCEEGTEPTCGGAPCVSDIGYWAGTDQGHATCDE